MHTNRETVKKILVVDDEPAVVLGTRVVLEADGYEVIGASDGLEALTILETERPDLVILDVVMPRMDGWETLREIQSNEQSKDIPVLMLTALDQPRHVQTGIDLGCTWYYTKPISDYDDFRLIVRRILEGLEPPSQDIQDW